VGSVPRSPRGQEFIEVAARLFAERGYHAVGINDISAELGLTGPAIYRHYKSKQELLVAVMDATMVRQLESIRAITSDLRDGDSALREIAANHVRYALAETENFRTWMTESRHLPDPDLRRLRYLQHLYIEEWIRVVGMIRHDLEYEEVRAVCHGAMALIQSITEEPAAVSSDDLVGLLTSMVINAVGAPPRRDSRRPRSRAPISKVARGRRFKNPR
jgi:AcrR family transcriptional regulator